MESEVKIKTINDVSNKVIRIAIGKGRGFQEALDFLKIEKSMEFEQFMDGVIPVYFDERNKIQLVMVRSNDLPWLLMQGHVDVAIGSSVWFEEYNFSKLDLFTELEVKKCRLSLITSERLDLSKIKTICTRFPNLTKQYAELNDIDPKIILMTGCHEVALTLKISDAIIDIIETGRTIERMKFFELDCLSTVSHGIWIRKGDIFSSGKLKSFLYYSYV